MRIKILFLFIALTALLTGCSKPSEENGTSVESISVSPSSLELKVGGTGLLTLEVLPETAEGYTVEWISSDTTVATVHNGNVTAVSVGTATITVSVENLRDEAIITVVSEGDEPDPDEPAEDPQVGDFFYSDGTWSSNLNASKEVIGIVFYIGNPAKDDRFLREEHPQCTHGLVVAAYDYGPTPWQSNNTAYGTTVGSWTAANTSYESIVSTGNREGVIDMMLGYNNTLAIGMFNAAPGNSRWPVEAVAGLADFREDYPAPSSTSGWYLPSIKELILLCDSGGTDYQAFLGKLYNNDNYRLVNSKLSAAGAQILGADGLGFYYSSTEQNTVEACCAISINNSLTASGTKNNSTMYYARYVLAF